MSDVARAMDRSGLLTVERARVLQLAAADDRASGYKCSHPELAGMGWTHPWPDEPVTPPGVTLRRLAAMPSPNGRRKNMRRPAWVAEPTMWSRTCG